MMKFSLLVIKYAYSFRWYSLQSTSSFPGNGEALRHYGWSILQKPCCCLKPKPSIHQRDEDAAYALSVLDAFPAYCRYSVNVPKGTAFSAARFLRPVAGLKICRKLPRKINCLIAFYSWNKAMVINYQKSTVPEATARCSEWRRKQRSLFRFEHSPVTGLKLRTSVVVFKAAACCEGKLSDEVSWRNFRRNFLFGCYGGRCQYM